MIAEAPILETGWKPLTDGMVIRAGDESFDGHRWTPVHACWHGHIFQSAQFCPMRRNAGLTGTGRR